MLQCAYAPMRPCDCAPMRLSGYASMLPCSHERMQSRVCALMCPCAHYGHPAPGCKRRRSALAGAAFALGSGPRARPSAGAAYTIRGRYGEVAGVAPLLKPLLHLAGVLERDLDTRGPSTLSPKP
eukprot:327969-Chlamydomonas_euryale.AAC.1